MAEFDPLIGDAGEGDLDEIMKDLVSVFGSAQAVLPLEIPPIVDSMVLDAEQILEEFCSTAIQEEEVDAGGEATRGGDLAQETTRGGRVVVDSWEEEVIASEDALSHAGARDDQMELEGERDDVMRLNPVRIN